MSSARAVTVVGSLNLDLVVRAAKAPAAGETVTGSHFARHPGGKGGNQAAAAGRLASGAPVAMIGCVGDDAEGAYLCAALADAGVDASGIVRTGEAGTGIAVITVSAGGENRIVLVPGANACFTPGVLGQQHEVLTGAGVLLLQLEIPLPTVQTAARMGREKHAVVILDPAPARPLPAQLLRLCDFLTPNLGELATLTGSVLPEAAPLDSVRAAARELVATGARAVVVKLGPRGVLLVDGEGAVHVPGFAVDAVDTTAAGDAWNGAFAIGLHERHPPEEAARFANAAAALSVTRHGAQSSLPTRAEVDAFLIARVPA